LGISAYMFGLAHSRDLHAGHSSVQIAHQRWAWIGRLWLGNRGDRQTSQMERVPLHEIATVLAVDNKPSSINRCCVVARWAARAGSRARDKPDTPGPDTMPR
jgi:hypothetical protein